MRHQWNGDLAMDVAFVIVTALLLLTGAVVMNWIYAIFVAVQ